MRKIALLIFLASTLFSADLGQIRVDLKQGVSGKFTQIKKIAGFSSPIKSSGDFKLLANEMIWSTKTPIKNELKITKDGIFSLVNKQWQKTKSNVDGELLVAIFSLDEARLKKSFDITISEKNGGFSALLVPKNLLLKQIFKQIKISGENHVKSVIIQEVSGDETVNEFYDIKP